MVVPRCQIHYKLIQLVVLVMQQLSLVLIPVRVEALALVVAITFAVARFGPVGPQSIAGAGINLGAEDRIGAAGEAQLRPQEASSLRDLAITQHYTRFDPVDYLKAKVERVYQQVLDAELEVEHQPAQHP